MSSHRVAEKSWDGHRMPLCLLLLLLLLGATAALPLEGGPASQDHGHMQEVAEIKESSLLTSLAWWLEWISQASGRPLIGGEASKMSKQQEGPSQATGGPLIGGEASKMSKRWEGPPLPQSTHQHKMPCKNFFWKTFSSCK